MSDVRVRMKDGTERHFPETSRAGGSWCTCVRYVENWVVVIDAYEKETAIPMADVDDVLTTPTRRW